VTGNINREPTTDPEKCAGGAGLIEMGPASMRYVPSAPNVPSARTIGCELTVPTADHQIAGGLGDGQTGAAFRRPSTGRKRAVSRGNGITLTADQGTARDERQDDHALPSYDSLYRSRDPNQNRRPSNRCARTE
jgi:hypothetical protein